MNDTLPSLPSVLVVCAHPDDESFGLGAVLSTLAATGSRLSVVCFTHGEASTLHGVDGDLHAIRADELTTAGAVLGVTRLELLDYPDGQLDAHPVDELAAHVVRVARVVDASVLLAFDDGGITGHPDHQRATDAALAAATGLGCPVLAWTIPDTVADRLNDEFSTTFAGRPELEIDLSITVDRARQLDAIGCHRSQSSDNPVLWRRLELLGPTEHLRYLRPAAEAFPSSQPLRDEHRALQPELDAVRVAAQAVGRPDAADHADRARRLLARHLIPHMVAEEAVLYPVIDRLDGCDATATLRRDHDAIRDLATLLDQLRADGPDSELRAALHRLDALVRRHLATEEEVLYPVLDTRLDHQQAAEVIAGMHQVERDLYRTEATGVARP